MAYRVYKCKNNPDLFCLICGVYMVHSTRKITPLIKTAYLNYFGMELPGKEPWVPRNSCSTCNSTLTKWYNGENIHLSFGKPMIWKEVVDHFQCYFCVINLVGINTKKRKSLQYPDVESVIKPVPHSDVLTKPVSPNAMLISSESSCLNTTSESDTVNTKSILPHKIEQPELNDLIRDLKLSKVDGELLGSRLQQWNVLHSATKISIFRDRSKQFSPYFTSIENKSFCSNIRGLFDAFQFSHNPKEWRLFIDGSKYSLKAALLHKGNLLPTIPVYHSVGSKETYDCMKEMLELIQYKEYKWKVCADLKVIAIITGLQGGYTKYCCFLCCWDSRAREHHYTDTNWPSRVTLEPGSLNVKNKPLIDPDMVILPPLHIKLGLVKNFIKSMDKDSAAFKYLQNFFPTISSAKIKEGVLVGPQIRKLLLDNGFKQVLTKDQLNAWNSFEAVVDGFLGNHKAENYKELISNLLKNYKKIKVNMSLKIHFLDSHLDSFPVNLGAESDKQGERFHQDMLTLENRYQGYWGTEMLGDYCWSIIRETDPSVYKKQSNKTHIPLYKKK